MKKNRLNTILILIVLGIWVVIIIRVKDTVNAEGESKEALKEFSNAEISNYNFKSNKLNLNYRDPFSSEKPKTKTPFVIKPIIKKELPKFVWPEIRYTGLIKSKNSSGDVALISVGYKTYTVHQGHVVDSVFLVSRVTSDSLKISVGKDFRWVKRNK